MLWILGIGVGLALLFAFPKQMFSLICLIAVGAGLLFYVEHQKTETRKQRQASVVMSPTFDLGRCSSEFPILIAFKNGSSENLLSVNFELSGYQDGFSTPIYKTGPSYSSDRILAPGQSYEACWSVPSLTYGQRSMPPENLSWRATYSYASFGPPP